MSSRPASAPLIDEELTADEILYRQHQLESAARKKFPWDASECTLYMDIAERQLLFACLTCDPCNAVCYACGLRCHAEHNIVELDSKRGFRCDCGTSRIPQTKCCLRRTENDEWPNSHLVYNQNFKGKFCICSESVNDESYGAGAMFQCLLGTRCGEDWFHARCIVGITRAEELSREQEADSAMPSDAADETLSEDSLASGVELDTVFPELPAHFGGLICPNCMSDVPQIVDSPIVEATVNKFILLKENYPDIVSETLELAPLRRQFPFLATEEECYRPDKDDDGSTLLEAGEKALQNLPHEAVMSGLARFNEMQSELMTYLREISVEGRAVTRDDVERFFASR